MSREIQATIDRLAEELQRSVVINDPGVRMLFASRHFGDEDPARVNAVLHRDAGPQVIGHVLAQGVSTWTTAGVVPAAPDLGMHARVCVPVRWRGELLGLVVLIDADGTMTTGELRHIVEVTDRLAPLLLAEGDGAAAGRQRQQEAAVRDLLDDTGPVRRAALHALHELGAAGADDDRDATTVQVVHLSLTAAGGEQPSAGHVETALRHATGSPHAEPTGHRRLVALGPSHADLVLSGPRAVPDEPLRAYAARLVAAVEQVAAGRFRCVAGVGGAATGLGHAWASHRQAVLAARAAEEPGADAVQTWAGLGVLSVLLRLPRATPEAEEAVLPDELQRLLAADPERRLTHTVRVFLDHAGSVPRTAAALHLHRTTLYYRLDRVRDLAGLDLDDGRTRLALHAGLTLLDRTRPAAAVLPPSDR